MIDGSITVMKKYVHSETPARDAMVSDWLMVALGGAIGAVLRFYVNEALPTEAHPWGTLTVNLVGSVLLGSLTALFAANALSEQQVLFLGVGVLGAFTTLSTFSAETAALADDGRWLTALAYVGLTGVVAPLLAFLSWKGTGHWLA